jgi:membrane protease YdiL (CAAX protease family)
MCNLHIYLMSLPALPAHLIAATSTSTRRATAGLLAITLAGAWAMAPTHVLWMLVVTPVLEEIVFRAGLQEELLRQARLRAAMGAFSANLLTALAFAAAHLALRPSLLAGLTVLPALLIGAVYQRQRRVAPCIVLHALFNAGWLLWAGLPN